MIRTLTAFTGALLLCSGALAAPAAAPDFEAARKYTQGALTVEVSRPTLYSTAAEDGGQHYALNLAVRIDNRLGRSVRVDLGSTTVLDRMDHPLTSPDAYRDGKPVSVDPEVKNREQAVLQLFFNVKHPVLLDRFDFHWAVIDKGQALQEITPYLATGLPQASPAAAVAPPAAPAGRPMGGQPEATLRGPGKRTNQAAAMLASYHFYRDLLHADILGSSMQPPSGLPWTTVQVAPRELPMDGGALGF